jgi:hypothetical protein
MTKVVVFMPRVVLQSFMNEDLHCRLNDTNASLILRPDSKISLTHFSENDDGSHQISIRMPGVINEWYGCFRIFFFVHTSLQIKSIGRDCLP